MIWTTLTGKLEQAKRLDPVVNAVTGAVEAVLPRGAVKDALHGTWLGHSLHPMLVALPIGMWSGASLLDLTGGPSSRRAAKRLVGAGVLAVLPTAASGLADWSELGDARSPRRVGLVHALANTATTVAYAASWLARRKGDQARGRNLALLGTGGLVVSGYLGGHLAYSQGVGVSRNADLSHQPTQWTDACAVADLHGGTPLRAQVAGQPVALVEAAGSIAAMGATCSHYGAPLDEGEVRDECLICPWHGSAFRLRDGSVAHGPATVPQPSYDVQRVGDRVQVRVRR